MALGCSVSDLLVLQNIFIDNFCYLLIICCVECADSCEFKVALSV